MGFCGCYEEFVYRLVIGEKNICSLIGSHKPSLLHSSVVSTEDKYIRITKYSLSVKLALLVIELRLKNQMLLMLILSSWVGFD